MTAHNSTQRKSGGTGIGLSISKYLVGRWSIFIRELIPGREHLTIESRVAKVRKKGGWEDEEDIQERKNKPRKSKEN